MLKAISAARAVSGLGAVADRKNAQPSFPHLVSSFSSSSSSSSPFCCSVRLGFGTGRRRLPTPILISCKYSRGGAGRSGGNADDGDPDFLEASLLLPETISHYRMRKQGYEPMKWHSSSGWFAFSLHTGELRPDINLIRHNLFHRFQSPTMFLKISCEADFLLPILVGEVAIERLIDGLVEDGNWDYPDQLQFVRNLLEKLGYEVKMVRITERVYNTYFSRLYFSKPGNNNILSVDARPSDAINIANRCKAPIYVSKQIVLTDAIKIGYGTRRMHNSKSTYDVFLDSAADGPDAVAEELVLLKNMDMAIKEERYDDAAMWRDRLVELRESRHEQ